jgi:Arc/MetJ-type ribon-helix-helix transcriptional regulator
MVSMTERQRERGGDTEKVTINLGYVDLGRIDLLVREGFYSNRTDLIRTAIRSLLAEHGETVRRTAARQTLELGMRDLGRADLEAARDAGAPLDVAVIGLVRIAADVDAALARAAIRSINVLGALHASAEVRAALGDRIHKP